MKTPKLNLTRKEFDKVYEPCEDSFLFLDLLEQEIGYLKELDPLKILEVGSGSGIIITFIAQLLGNDRCYFSTDINPFACKATLKTTILNNVNVDIINTKFIDGINQKFDLCLFNPPYVVTTNEEITGDLQRSWAGGIDGRVVIDEFLSRLDDITRVCYLLVINENNPNEIMEIMNSRGWKSEKVIYRAVGWEGQSILKFVKQ
ncbi:HemK methyltransferase member 2 [Boothiomyces macroporosus]|uniref:HemK methyltransferase member 2 n=1 Tax=Boothiomyces macroporosus TaxID=261099 RepID=A0AAD5UA13_9FUNG|nr:HemK methyltransferase member 2 [Boothiomyces macroporosus]